MVKTKEKGTSKQSIQQNDHNVTNFHFSSPKTFKIYIKAFLRNP